MLPNSRPDYLAGYPAELTSQIRQLIEQDKLADRLLYKYPQAHDIRTDRALHDYAQDIKARHLRNAAPLGRVCYDSKLHDLRNALGLHSRISRVQGGKLQSKRELRVASVFREMPEAFLRMIVVHELAHFKEGEHNKAFYQLCRHMEPDYHQLEFDLRVYLTHLEATGRALWATKPGGLTSPVPSPTCP
ncbi:MAG: DUF45 domain-containing protein [Gallionella sp.]|nr:DUF45 domain-containing protein [Gallionella sp.]MDD4946643.1 DUF45 domain-containing protein [Gallionella sp.]MDD5612963.1 DUF45 domain-containing protein [Gallionella sp.]